MADWSDLPLDILTLFAERLPGAEEFVSFGAVCKSWMDAAIHVNKGRRFNPWMMVSKLEDDTRGIRTFYDLSTGKFYDIQLPQLQGRKCWGTNYGWLITFGLDYEIFLFNPLTQAKICLPSQLKLDPGNWLRRPINNCRNFIKKIAISSDPSDYSMGSPTVMASFGSGRMPAFASIGDQTWTTMTHPYSTVDIIFFKGNFYSVNPHGEVSIYSINAGVPYTMVIAPPPKNCDVLGTFYLVEISASLYLINRSYDDPSDDDDDDGKDSDDEDFIPSELNKATVFFNAYKLVLRKKKWVFRRHLDGYSLFLGNNQSFAISPLDYPQFKPNCVYFTDDYNEGGETDYLDMGIYDYENETIIKSFDNCGRPPASELSGPVFFMPQLSMLQLRCLFSLYVR